MGHGCRSRGEQEFPALQCCCSVGNRLEIEVVEQVCAHSDDGKRMDWKRYARQCADVLNTVAANQVAQFAILTRSLPFTAITS
jgi:hypothetical protein